MTSHMLQVAWRSATGAVLLPTKSRMLRIIEVCHTGVISPPHSMFGNWNQYFRSPAALYCECFVVLGSQPSSFVEDAVSQLWFDGLSHRIMLRSCSVAMALEYVQVKAGTGDPRALEMLTSVFEPIALPQPGFSELFVDMTAAKQVVSVISMVKLYSHSTVTVTPNIKYKL